MAGGEGKRLRPLTENIPKPMLPIGRKPLLQIIIEKLKKCGLTDIVIATGYKDHIIKSYFKDGSHLGINVTYISEKHRMGTVGPIKLIEKKLSPAFLVLNGDVLTNFDFRKIMDYHNEHNNEMTIGVCQYNFQVPFGVIETLNGDGHITGIKEKPRLDFLILSGIYVLNASVLRYVPHGNPYDINHLMEDALKDNKKIKYYFIEDKWLDIGRLEDYEYANNNWNEWM